MVLCIIALTGLLVTTGIASIQAKTLKEAHAHERRASTPSNTVDLIVFSDTHIGDLATIKSGSDNLTSYQRYALLLTSTNQYSATVMVNCGDLTTGGSGIVQTQMYNDYQRLSNASRNNILNVKGNHDQNNYAYFNLIGPETLWGASFFDKEVYRDMLIISIGCVADSFADWLNQGVTYTQYQANAIKNTIYSSLWNQTSYHFLFMHFEPDSTWPIPAKFGVPTIITQYCKYFDVVFCGHEGGSACVLQQQNATVIHAAHLGDGTVATDTYLTVTITRTTHTVTVIAHNFVVGTTQPLYSFSLQRNHEETFSARHPDQSRSFAVSRVWGDKKDSHGN